MSHDQAARAREFLELHRLGTPLLMANAWDLGSARLLATAGFKALATTSSGLAASGPGAVARQKGVGDESVSEAPILTS